MSRRSPRSADNSPYRRKKSLRPDETTPDDDVESEEEADGSLEPGQMAQLIVDMRNGAVDRQAANAISGPLNDLAKAFAMQAEILRGVHESQVELNETLKKDGKAEMMVNATDSLNSTFKGVRSVQQKLLDELEDRGKRSRSNVTWAIGASLAIVVTIVGLFWWKDLRDADKISDISEQVQRKNSALLDASFAKLDEIGSSAESWRKLADDARRQVRTLESELGELKARNGDLERSMKESRGLSTAESGELDRLRRAEARTKPEIDRLTSRVKEIEQELATTLQRLETAREEANHLRMDVIAKLNRVGAERMAAQDEDDATKKRVIGAKEARDVKAAADKGRKEAPQPTPSSQRVLDDLNELMANHRGSRVYRFESIGKVGKHHLEDVVLTESAAGEGVIKRVRAKKLDVTISGRGDIVEINFSGGDVQQRRPQGSMGPWTSFYNSRYRVTIYCLNGEKWMARNYGFFIVN